MYRTILARPVGMCYLNDYNHYKIPAICPSCDLLFVLECKVGELKGAKYSLHGFRYHMLGQVFSTLSNDAESNAFVKIFLLHILAKLSLLFIDTLDFLSVSCLTMISFRTPCVQVITYI